MLKASATNSAPWVSRLYSLPLITTVLFLLVDGFTDEASAGVWSVASVVLGDSKSRANNISLTRRPGVSAKSLTMSCAAFSPASPTHLADTSIQLEFAPSHCADRRRT